MGNFLNDILHLIQIDFFIAYGLYSLVYIVLIIISSYNEKIQTIDGYCNNFTTFCGILYFVIFISATIINFIEADTESKNIFLNRLLGRHWFAYWLQPLIWIVPTQLLRINQLNRLLLVRLVFALILIITFEQYVIIITSLERDYLPSGWSTSKPEIEFPIMQIITGCCFKITIFVLLSFIYHWFKMNIKSLAHSLLRLSTNS